MTQAPDKIEFHPVANIFPLIDGQEFAALVADIRAHGLREPIVLHEGMILDGRNRYLACTDADVAPRFVVYGGVDPVAYVVSLNLHRRHLNESQRAMVAAEIANLGEGRPWPAESLPQLPGVTASIEAVTQTAAADMLNVSRAAVQRAATVRDHATPALVQKVQRGEVSVSAAAEIARLPEPEQALVAAMTDAEIVARAKEIRLNHRAHGTGDNEWYTPAAYIEAAREVMGGIDLDPASSSAANRVVRAARFLSISDDGLTQEWRGKVWLNPPYTQPDIQRFMQKLIDEFSAGRVGEAIALTHNYTDTAWFHLTSSAANGICFTRGRIAFEAPDGRKAAPTQGQAFFYFGPNFAKFAEVFGRFGSIVVRHVI